MYDHLKQYRCTIIRGKSKKEMDDLLPVYAKIINGICPCRTEEFDARFNNAFQCFLPESERIKKTLDNHRTEISGKLFGMYYRSDDGMVYESQRTAKYLEDNDQPAFFKDVCFKMQFPNGMDTSYKLQDRISKKINVRPNAFVLKLLQLAKIANERITVKDIGYYVLNSLNVLQGKANPYEVLEVIANDHKAGIQRVIKAFDENGKPKASSFNMQHIREQLNYLELANLIRVTDDKRVVLNPKEEETINLFTKDFDKEPDFNVYSYNLELLEVRKKFQYDWDSYYARLSAYASMFSTNPDALVFNENDDKLEEKKPKKQGINLTEFGDEGEALVFAYEKERVSAFNVRLVNKVLSLGKIKGIGYDIQSVIAEPGDEAEFVKYIEVKSTKRFTCPDITDPFWLDTFNVTRNEYIAAQQYKGYYCIYRVFFTRYGVSGFVINDVADKIKDGRIQCTPIRYRFDYSSNSVDSVITLKGAKVNV